MSINNSKQFLVTQLIWMGISLAISLSISLIVPFPFSIAAIFAVFILLNFYIRNKMMKKIGSGMGGMFGSISSSPTFGGAGNSISKYYCG